MKDFYKTLAEAEALDHRELNEMVAEAKEKRENKKPVNKILNQIKDKMSKLLNPKE